MTSIIESLPKARKTFFEDLIIELLPAHLLELLLLNLFLLVLEEVFELGCFRVDTGDRGC